MSSNTPRSRFPSMKQTHDRPNPSQLAEAVLVAASRGPIAGGSAVAGHDVVISSLGSKLSRKPTTLLSDGTRNVVGAMKAAGVPRLICITGIGAGDSRGHGGFLYDRLILPLLLAEIYEDKTRQE